MNLPPSLLKPELLALGLMSGTSADGVDGAIIRTDGHKIIALGPTHYTPYPPSLKNKILAIYGKYEEKSHDFLAREILDYHEDCMRALLNKIDEPVDLIGLHGQTLFHAPPRTLQIGDGEEFAQRMGIPVVDQLRLNDLAHGGQGAPLVPTFHHALAKDLPKPLGILNMGGVANLTWLGPQEGDLLAFDVGPGNGLIDDLVRQQTERPYDENGAIAAQGKVNQDLLSHWLTHPFFSLTPPKSLDRQTFQFCLEEVKEETLENAVATLTAFTAAAFAKALEFLPQPPPLWLMAGGGTHNTTLLRMLAEKSEGKVVRASDKGWNTDALEAQAWGFLAVRSLRGLPFSFPTTTGVPQPLGGGRLNLGGW